MKPVTVTDDDFEQIVGNSSQPVLVDFWAPWCGPCRMLAPILDEIATEYGDQALVAKVNVDQNPETAARFGIKALPTLIVFRGGEVIKTVHGLAPKTKLVEALTA